MLDRRSGQPTPFAYDRRHPFRARRRDRNGLPRLLFINIGDLWGRWLDFISR